ncbi:MAG TPA: 2-phosphosulfolactate phosphatase, partial [Candidatus Kapabacteria bacterium]
VGRGALVYPFAFKDERAASYADELHAELAHKRGESTYSLSPGSLLDIPDKTKLVLPSPNGSELSTLITSKTIFTACLRNAKTVALQASSMSKSIGVIAAGEKWEDNSMRFAIEDLLGAGAVISCFENELSIEAKSARLVFDSNENNIKGVLLQSISGQELIDRGYRSDVMIASEVNVSAAAPILIDGAFVQS